MALNKYEIYSKYPAPTVAGQLHAIIEADYFRSQGDQILFYIRATNAPFKRETKAAFAEQETTEVRFAEELVAQFQQNAIVGLKKLA